MESNEFYKVKYVAGVKPVEILSWPFASTHAIENGGPLDYEHACKIASLLDLGKDAEIIRIVRTIPLKLHFTKNVIIDFPEELFQEKHFNLEMLERWLVDNRPDLMVEYGDYQMTFEEVY